MENCEKHSKKLCAQCKYYDYCDRASRCDGKCYDCDDNGCENNPVNKKSPTKKVDELKFLLTSVFVINQTSEYKDSDISLICAIFDSNGRFEKLWQFSAYLVQKGFKIVEVGSDDKFLDGNIPKASVETLLILRACAKGQPAINGDSIEISGKYYKPGT